MMTNSNPTRVVDGFGAGTGATLSGISVLAVSIPCISSPSLAAVRQQLTECLRADVFTPGEYHLATGRIALTDDAPQLQRRQRNIVRVQQAREAAQHAQAVAQRAQRGRTSDYAGELAAAHAEAAFIAETGLSYAAVATL